MQVEAATCRTLASLMVQFWACFHAFLNLSIAFLGLSFDISSSAFANSSSAFSISLPTFHKALLLGYMGIIMPLGQNIKNIKNMAIRIRFNELLMSLVINQASTSVKTILVEVANAF